MKQKNAEASKNIFSWSTAIQETSSVQKSLKGRSTIETDLQTTLSLHLYGWGLSGSDWRTHLKVIKVAKTSEFFQSQ